ncbi:ABC transporter substrate-binding protein [Roseovarius sp. ZX-A-9]|uniref:ABC transporter substrate-binding protein n=1 Tax=Roseovarius sp. ZX-A-9 TaxID=3014783 RepID=UPI00232F1879|nr:ABC transporter substrate-binding protein [Roseovarius sp. ZX-A-9]
MKNNDKSLILPGQSEMSRRDFVSRALAMGVALPAAMSLTGNSAMAATPKQGGVMRIGLGLGSTTNTLDPATFEDTYMQVVGFGLRNCLTEIGNDDELIPELAESWEGSPDSKEWTFVLRKGIEFHSGKTMDAEDVIGSIQHHLGENSTSLVNSILSPIQEIKADGTHTVVITLSDGNADFPFLLSDYHIAIMPVRDGVVDWQSGDGTGAYKLKSFEPGISTSMVRNPNYWKEGHGHFDEVEVLSIIDTNARTSALVSGQIDAMDRVDLKTAHLLGKRPGINLKETQGTLHYVYSMFCDTAPFDNPDVRLALKYGIDRQDLLDKLLFGHGYVGNDHPIGRSNKYFAKDLPQRPYDPDRAQFHLKKAGLTELTVPLSAADSAFSGAIDGALLYKEHASKAGINIDVTREPNDGYWANVWNKKPFVASYWSGRVTEDWVFSSIYAKGVSLNETHWANDRFNDLLGQARSEQDTSKRGEMYYEMQQLCSDDGGVLAPVFSNYVFATNDKVAHNRMSAAWDMDGIKCLERWWLA